ncbi:MAG TPA: PEP-CTERM sorting domain-containing protein [Burkholderiales bacterium]|nr:PEP-CTERM sorting domain-containing protein [Burkholderiales bacterium]
MIRKLLKLFALATVAAVTPAQAVLIGGVEFPQGMASFADSVVSYAPGPTAPTAPHQGAFNALGAPNYNGVNSCASQAACTFVSLGDGGSIVLRFDDNRLTGSGSSAADLWIFEIGPQVEAMFVDISMDGVNWQEVGRVGGSTAGVDIDAYGFGLLHQFAFVRLTDDPDADGQTGITVGADIDALGAISTVAVIPEPQNYALLLAGLGLMGFVARRRHATSTATARR